MFRLKSFQIEDDNSQFTNVDLIDDNKDQTPNYFSLIVGNNGAGKSRLLGSIARILTGKHTTKKNLMFNISDASMIGIPSKVITVSNSLSDKFPFDDSYFSYRRSDFNFSELKYNYLGTRGRLGSSSTVLIRRAIDILIENYSNFNTAHSYEYIFDYLEYEPIIKLEYKFSNHDLWIHDRNLEPQDIINFINRKISYGGLMQKTYENFIIQYSHKFEQLCYFLNDIRNNLNSKYELLINFSSNNIYRLSNDHTIYEEELKVYELLNILRKLNIVRSFETKLYKKNGNVFSFSDASSGESNILVTLIALIPLICDNCCILIDEPEISLHPSWQYRYIELLSKIFLKFKGCHIIIASHSHFIISDLPPFGSSVINFKRQNGYLKSILLSQTTYGWSAENILIDIFEMPTSRNFYLSQIIGEALELLANQKRNSQRFRDIENQLSIIEPKLKDEDPLKFIIKSFVNI